MRSTSVHSSNPLFGLFILMWIAVIAVKALLHVSVYQECRAKERPRHTVVYCAYLASRGP